MSLLAAWSLFSGHNSHCNPASFGQQEPMLDRRVEPPEKEQLGQAVVDPVDGKQLMGGCVAAG